MTPTWRPRPSGLAICSTDMEAIVHPDGRLIWRGQTIALRAWRRAACGSTKWRATAPPPPDCCRCGGFFTGRTASRRRAARCRSSRSPPTDGWCDDPSDREYNRFVHLPYDARHEELWRRDEVYDVIAVLGWNDQPVVEAARIGDFSACRAAGLRADRRAASPWHFRTSRAFWPRG